MKIKRELIEIVKNSWVYCGELRQEQFPTGEKFYSGKIKIPYGYGKEDFGIFAVFDNKNKSIVIFGREKIMDGYYEKLGILREKMR